MAEADRHNMNAPDIQIVVAGHKPTEMPSDRMYLPVQVNAAENPSIAGFQPDNEGDNISVMNFRYCELTALWWAWRNLNADYIGMCQYRRFFCTLGKKSGRTLGDVLSLVEARQLLEQADVILPVPRNYRVQTLAQHFQGYSFAEPDDMNMFRASIQKIAPDYVKAFDRVMARRKGHMCNMFVLRRDLLNEYCMWLFAVMSELDLRIDEKRTRILGYFAEHMIDIWTEHNGIGYVETGSVFLDRDNEIRKKLGYALRLVGLKNASDRVTRRQS